MTNNSQKQVFRGGWEELENAVHTTNQKLISGDPKGFFVKPDGTKVFVVNASGSSVEVYPLAIPWDIATLGSLEASFTLPVTTFVGIFFKDDGSRMYVIEGNTDSLYQYVLPIPWDVTSIVDAPDIVPFTGGADPNAQCTFSINGEFVFFSNGDVVIRNVLSTPWDITTIGAETEFIPTPFTPFSIAFKPGGDKMYLGTSDNGKQIIEYDLPTPYDITTAILSGNIIVLLISTFAIYFRTNGLDIFVLDTNSDIISKLHLKTAWNISTTSLFPNNFNLTQSGLSDVHWKPDGTKFFTLDVTSNLLKEYDVSVPWNASTGVLGNTFDVTAAVGEPSPVGMFWSLDGLRCVIVGSVFVTVFQLNAATPWDVSTLSDSGIFFSLNSPINTPDGIFFSTDEKYFYIVNKTSVTPGIYQFEMLTPGDITTAVDTGNFLSVSSQGDPTDVFIKSDGMQVYVLTTNSALVSRYLLSVPWDISTAILQDSFDISPFDSNPPGMYIRLHDGKKLFVIGNTTQTLYSFDMSREFNDQLFLTSMGYDDGNTFGYDINWLNFKWINRIPLTINASQVPTTQNNFPLLINSTIPELVGISADELRFAGIDNKQLDYEIQSFNPSTGALIAWIKKPTISDGDIIYVYYGNPSAIDEQNSIEVWSENYKSVYHLDADFNDSAINAQALTNFGTTQVPGKIGNARNFTGVVTDYLIKNPFTGFPSDEHSCSFLAKSSGVFDGIFSYATTATANSFLVFGQVIGRIIVGTATSNTGVSIPDDGNFHIMTVQWRSSDGVIEVYLDGVLEFSDVNLAIGQTMLDGGSLVLGQDQDTVGGGFQGDQAYDGILEEITLSNKMRSADWNKTISNNQLNPSAFYAIGNEETVPISDEMGYDLH